MEFSLTFTHDCINSHPYCLKKIKSIFVCGVWTLTVTLFKTMDIKKNTRITQSEYFRLTQSQFEEVQ